MPRRVVVLSLTFAVVLAVAATRRAEFRSCPPMRPLPGPSKTPLDKEGPARFVDAAKGDDKAAGSEAAPWRTLRHAVGQLQAGETLYLRGGTYYERVTISRGGTAERPVTIRSYPGELAVLDGGFREFAETPDKAWEPLPGGEYRSTATYPELAEDTPAVSWHQNNPDHPRLHVGPAPKDDPARGVVHGIYGSGYFSNVVKVLGNFADSMVPLHGYYHRPDLPADDEQLKRRPPLDCGPGVWLDLKTQRVHARLAATEQKHLGELNYTCEADPRKVPLVIGGSRVVVHVTASHVRLRDLVVRGTRSRCVNVEGGTDVTIDRCTLYGGAPALQIQSTRGFRLLHSALRGVCAPWSSRSSEKYHGISCYLFIADGTAPMNRDVEMAWCEFTDNHDGLILTSIDGLKFHHNYVDNFNDDGLYLTTDMPAGRDYHFHQNYLSRSLSMLAFAGKGDDQKGREANFYRNVFDLRAGMNNGTGFTTSRTCGDHGSPIWKPMRFYHNTILTAETPWRNYYAAGLAKALKETSRTYLNNVVYHTAGTPGFHFEVQGEQLADGNLHWSPDVPEKDRATFLAKGRMPPPRQPNWFAESKKTYPAGWTANDVFADPLFVALDKEATDLRLQPKSPAIDAGVAVPKEWPDPLREADAGKPDIGAFPAGAKAWAVGIDGRLTAFGTPNRER